MRIAVCETMDELLVGSDAWRFLVRQCQDISANMLILPDLPFGSWAFSQQEVKEESLADAVQAHQDGIESFGELGAEKVLATRPVFEGSDAFIEAFVWDSEAGVKAVHTQQFLPNIEGDYKSRWFKRGNKGFEIADIDGIKVGFLIGVEVMFSEWARFYGRQGAHLIAVPRSIYTPTWHRWNTAFSMAAMSSGCYLASANRVGRDSFQNSFSGGACIYNPSGDLHEESSGAHSIVVSDLDLDLVEESRRDLPLIVDELPDSCVQKSGDSDSV